VVSLARLCCRGRERGVLDVEQWAELHREHFGGGVSIIEELIRRTGLRSETPPDPRPVARRPNCLMQSPG
jgi:hypothetical protein